MTRSENKPPLMAASEFLFGLSNDLHRTIEGQGSWHWAMGGGGQWAVGGFGHESGAVGSGFCGVSIGKPLGL